MTIHELKILPEYFKAQKAGKKNFEIRKNDRDYKVGDKLVLTEYDPKAKEFETMITDILEKHYDHD